MPLHTHMIAAYRARARFYEEAADRALVIAAAGGYHRNLVEAIEDQAKVLVLIEADAGRGDLWTEEAYRLADLKTALAEYHGPLDGRLAPGAPPLPDPHAATPYDVLAEFVRGLLGLEDEFSAADEEQRRTAFGAIAQCARAALQAAGDTGER